MPKKEKRTAKGKIDNRFSTSSMDIFSEEKFYETESEKENSKPSNQEESQFRGKLRQIFSHSESKSDSIGNVTISDEYTEKKEYVSKEYKYIQMKLNIEEISPQFKEELEEYRLSGINIRKATMEDLSIFVKLYNRAFMRGYDPWSPATEEQFKEILKHENTVVLIASTHGEDVGFIITDLEGDEKEIGVICGLGVDPRWQRQGIARYLGIASWDYFRKRDVKELRCEVYEGNDPSYKLIKSLHFEEYGTKEYTF